MTDIRKCESCGQKIHKDEPFEGERTEALIGEDFFDYDTAFDNFHKKYFKFYRWIIIAALLFILFLIKP